MTEPCRLYLITPPQLEPVRFAETLKAALDAGVADALDLLGKLVEVYRS